MLDRALNFAPAQQETYHFQLIPTVLSIVGKDSELPAEGTTYRFALFRGRQRVDENKFPIEANFQQTAGVQSMSVSACKLNFKLNFVPTTKPRKLDYLLKLTQNERGQDYEIGEYLFDPNSLISALREKGTAQSVLKTFFSEDYELDFEIYVEKSKEALEEAVRKGRTQQVEKQQQKEEPTNVDVVVVEKEIKDGIGEWTKVKPDFMLQSPEKPFEVGVVAIDNDRKPSPTFSEKQKLFSSKPRSQRNEEVSQQSVEKVPLIQTKFKQLAKANTPSEIKMKESEKIGKDTMSGDGGRSSGEQQKEKIFIWVFLILGAVVMYFSMHPNRKI